MTKHKYKKICPHCGTENSFSPSKIDPTRKTVYRKKCHSCKKRFKVHFTHEEIFSKTDLLEEKILDLIKNNKNFCKQISQELNLNYSKVWRKLKLMEKSNKIELVVKSSAKFYKIGKGPILEVPKSHKIISRLHNIKWKVKLISEPSNYDQIITPQIIKPNGWIKKIFILDKWKIEVNLTKTPNIVFDYLDPIFTDNLIQSMNENKENCKLYRDLLVKKFNFKLDPEITYCGDPTKPKEHASIPINTNLASHNITVTDRSNGEWTKIDESPPLNKPEVESSAISIHNLIQSGNRIDEIGKKIENFGDRMDRLEKSIVSLVDKLEKIFTPVDQNQNQKIKDLGKDSNLFI